MARRNKKNYNIGFGLQPTPKDPRDFNLAAIFSQADVAEIPATDWVVAPPFQIKHQLDTDLCTAFAVTAVSEDQERVDLSPEYQFAKTKQIRGEYEEWGADLRSACKSVVKFGSLPQGSSPYRVGANDRNTIANWERYHPGLDENAKPHRKRSYFRVDTGRYDTFDNIRASLWQNREEKATVITGVVWRPSWLGAPGGVIPKSSETGGYGHAIKVFGQKLFDGEPYLVVQNSYGEGCGDKGLFYFPREVVNREFTFGAYAFKDVDPKTIKVILNNSFKGEANMAEESIKYKLNKEEQARVWKGFLIAMAGVAITKILEIITQTDFGPWSELIVGTASFALNGVRIWLQGKAA